MDDDDDDDDWRPPAHEAHPADPSELDILSNPGTSIADSQDTASQGAVATPAARGGRQPGKPKVGGSSRFRGVTRHSTTGRYESHLWDANAVRPKQVWKPAAFRLVLRFATSADYLSDATCM